MNEPRYQALLTKYLELKKEHRALQELLMDQDYSLALEELQAMLDQHHWDKAIPIIASLASH